MWYSGYSYLCGIVVTVTYVAYWLQLPMWYSGYSYLCGIVVTVTSGIVVTVTYVV
jgi:hypothetical protein